MSPETVLIIEDDLEVRLLLKKAISRMAKYHVIEAADGREGLTRALNDNPSIILLDLALPHMDGLEIMKELQIQNRLIPIIIITADSRTETILSAFRLGAKDFLQKPFRMKEMQSALENALTEERLRRERDNLTQALARANRRQQRQLENWAALNYVARTISSTLDESEVFRRVVATANHLLDVEAGSLLLLDEAKNVLRFAVTLGGKTTHTLERVVPVGQGIAGWVAQHGQPIVVLDVHQDARFHANADQIPGFQTEAVICVPIKAKDRVLGVFEVINKHGQASGTTFTEQDEKLLQTLASWITVAVENARLHRSLQEHAAVKTLKQAVVTLAHHINNELMTHALEIDNLRQSALTDDEKVASLTRSSRDCSQRIAAIVHAMDQITDIRTTAYLGSENMIDIKELLNSQR